MATEILDNDAISALLAGAAESRVYAVPEQYGPLRHFDKEMRCTQRGCSSPTHFKLQQQPTCMIHCLRLMNQMLIDLEVEK